MISPADVRQDASASSAVVVRVSPGGQVSLMETKDGWALIARDGKMLGFVDEKALAGLH